MKFVVGAVVAFTLLVNQVFCYSRALKSVEGSMNDEIQNQIKELIVQYLAETANDDSARYIEGALPSEFGRERDRNKHHHHNNWHTNPALAAAAAAAPAAIPVLSASALPVAVAAENNEAARVEAAPAQNQTSVRIESSTIAASATVIPIIAGPAAPAPAQPQDQRPAAPVPAAPAISALPTAAPVTLPPRSTVDPVHHLNQVNKILGNVANGNIVGIVDESLAIRAPAPVRTLVTNILKVVFCNPIDRLFRRCAPNQVDAANNSVTG